MKKKGSEPPSLFDNLDLFAQAGDMPAAESVSGEGKEEPQEVQSGEESVSGDGVQSAPSVTSVKGLTGRGPMRDLYDFNFRQYSA